jgi:hypothetical protein
MATETRTETDVSGLTDSMNRVGINGENGEENRLGPDGEPAPRTEEEYAQSQLTLRAIVSSKEAGVIIGKAGKNVADLRDETGVKAGVSKVVQGVHDRVLTVTGGLDGISKAYAIVAKGLLEGAPQMGMGGVISSNGTHRKSRLSTPTIPPASPFFAYVELTFCFHSHSSPCFTPPDGYDHRSARTQD